MEISKIYLASILKVYPELNNIQAPGTCQEVTTSSADQTTGIADSDLHLYLTFENDPNSGTLAWAVGCHDRDDRPIVG